MGDNYAAETKCSNQTNVACVFARAADRGVQRRCPVEMLHPRGRDDIGALTGVRKHNCLQLTDFNLSKGCFGPTLFKIAPNGQ